MNKPELAEFYMDYIVDLRDKAMEECMDIEEYEYRVDRIIDDYVEKVRKKDA